MPETAKRIAIIPGDDAAPEAMSPTLALLRQLELPVEYGVLPDGEELEATTSRDERERLIRETVDSCDTVLFGATSGKTGGIGYLRWGKDTFANVRPIRWRPGYRSPLREPDGIDYVIVRENIEDLYLGLEGHLATLLESGLPTESRFGAPVAADGDEGRYAIKVISRQRTERVAHFSCQLAQRRRKLGHPGKITCSAKYNVLWQSDGFFRQIVRRVVEGYPDLTYEEFIVDDLAQRIVARPQDFDVVVLPNLYGDILADEAAGTIGGLGLAPSACYSDDFAYFEPVHGTAPDIAGEHAINPTATILSAAMMLEHLGFDEDAQRVESAINETYAEADSLTRDQGGSSTTEEFAQAVISRL